MINPVYVIQKKRDGQPLTTEEINFLISGYAKGEIPDYQIAAWAMAVFLQGMSPVEIADLTRAMLASGEILKPVDDTPRVDKHSTGGLGDKTSLILAPLLALFDLHVPMISGRGLGITGGTLDKLEAIPGYRTNLSETEVESVLKEIGCVITGASDKIVPADKKLYGLRDVTATVPSIPLITASILSKKRAESLDALILDVKFGSGAFMQTESEARALADSLLRTGYELGMKTVGLLTDMTQPLGKMVGNANEVYESIDILKGEGPSDVRKLAIELAAHLLLQTSRSENLKQARQDCAKRLDDGSAFERFEMMVKAHQGRLSETIPLGRKEDWMANESGFVQAMDGQRLGYAVIALGGGRQFAGQTIDHSVGLEMAVRVGDQVEKGDPLLAIYSSETSDLPAAKEWLKKAFTIGPNKPNQVPLFRELKSIPSPTN